MRRVTSESSGIRWVRSRSPGMRRVTSESSRIRSVTSRSPEIHSVRSASLASRSVTPALPRARSAALPLGAGGGPPRGTRTVSGGRSSIGRFARSRIPAPNTSAAQASASRLCPGGRSKIRIRIRTPHHAAAAAIAVPSPNGRWNTEPSARFFNRSRTPRAASTSAASTKVNDPNVETIRSSEPPAATRCSDPSRRQAGGRLRAKSEILATGETCIGLVPLGDLVFALFPAEVDLAPVAHGGEVDQPALEIADDHFHCVQLAGCCLELEKCLRDDPSRLPAAIAGHRLAERLAGLLVGEAVARCPKTLDPLHHPRERGI